MKKYSELVNKFVTILMKKGKKNTAWKIFYNLSFLLKTKTKENPELLINKAILKVRPLVKLQTKIISGRKHQIPFFIKTEDEERLALRDLIVNARKRSEKTLSEKLAAEILDIHNNKGTSLKNRETKNLLVLNNRASLKFLPKMKKI